MTTPLARPSQAGSYGLPGYGAPIPKGRPAALPRPRAMTIDYLIGDPSQTGKGLGATMIRAVVEATWRDWPETPAVVTAVVATNTRSWRALERAGFYRVGEGDMEPDNPIDTESHYVYRVDRPA